MSTYSVVASKPLVKKSKTVSKGNMFLNSAKKRKRKFLRKRDYNEFAFRTYYLLNPVQK